MLQARLKLIPSGWFKLMSAASKGNNPELWSKLVEELDEKLQLGLLDHLQRAASYHFEDETLFLEPGSIEDHEYLSREPVFQQLVLYVQTATKFEKVKLKTPEE